MKRTVRKIADYFTVATLVLVVGVAAAWLGRLGENEYSGPFRVVDGDSLEAGDLRFRLEGIDAPEYRQTCGKAGAEWACGRESARYLRSVMQGGGVRCHGLGVDKFDRILARCTDGTRDINGEMVERGWAVSFGDYEGHERRARDAGVGIWAGDFIRPREWRDLHADALGEGDGHAGLEGFSNWLRQIWQKMTETELGG